VFKNGREEKPIIKIAKFFVGNNFIEVKDDIFLYTSTIDSFHSICILDISLTKIKKVPIYHYPKKNSKSNRFECNLV